MEKWIQRLIGTDTIYDQINDLNRYITGLRGDISFLRGQVIATNRGMGRLIAKLDPTFAVDELDPARKTASDKIGDEVTKRLLAEHIASNKHKGD